MVKIGKSLLNTAGKAIGASIGAYFGGPTGAAAGYNGANTVLGAVGLGDDQIAADQQWEYQKKASDYAFNQNLQMWNMVNAYNDPSAQMERLQKAGLNPNLVYGGGNVTGNTSGSGPTYERPGGGFVDRSIQREQLALALKEHQQRITNQAIENDLARQRLVLSEREADRSDALAKAQIQAYKANLGLTDARIGDIYYNQSKSQSWLGKHIDDAVKYAGKAKNVVKKYSGYKSGISAELF